MDREIIKQNFGRIWPIHVRNFKSIGDLDLLIVLSVIGDRVLSERRTDKDADYATLFEKGENLPTPEVINLQSIADYTGIPKETVRRKINTLTERGWIVKNDEGLFDVTAKCRADLVGTTEQGITYLTRMMGLLSELKTKA